MRWAVVTWAAASVALAKPGSAVFPDAEGATAVERAVEIVERLTPADLERSFAVRPSETVPRFLLLGEAIADAEGEQLARLQEYAAAAARQRGAQLARRGPPFSDAEVETLLVMLLLDPPRFAADPRFRERMIAVLERGLDPTVPLEIRDRLLYALNRFSDLPFRHAERVQGAWGALRRSSQPLRIRFPSGDSLPPAFDLPIAATVFSFSSVYFEPEDTARLLRAVHRMAPSRRLLVLCDAPICGALTPLAAEMPLERIDTFGRPYSPWVRDVLSLRWSRDGRLIVALRPDTQIGRQQDAHMGQVLIGQLPDDLYAAWRPVWAPSPVPFHNGQVLLTGESAWISLHGVKALVRRLSGIRRPPAPPMDGGSAEVDAYLSTARQAADELGEFLGLPVRFVHPMSERESPHYPTLAGGEPYDLDSLLTLLPGDGSLRALVGDLDAGSELLTGLDAAALDRLADGYGLTHGGDELRRQLLEAHGDDRSLALQRFLDEVAGYLAATAGAVERLPLLRIPLDLVDRPLSHEDFLIGWNNVNLERLPGGGRRAEGFASLLEPGDRLAREAYARAGYELYLLPPLVESVIRNGGYRCATHPVRPPPVGSGGIRPM